MLLCSMIWYNEESYKYAFLKILSCSAIHDYIYAFIVTSSISEIRWQSNQNRICFYQTSAPSNIQETNMTNNSSIFKKPWYFSWDRFQYESEVWCRNQYNIILGFVREFSLSGALYSALSTRFLRLTLTSYNWQELLRLEGSRQVVS